MSPQSSGSDLNPNVKSLEETDQGPAFDQISGRRSFTVSSSGATGPLTTSSRMVRLRRAQFQGLLAEPTQQFQHDARSSLGDQSVTHMGEIAFIDSGISDLDAFLAGLRSDVDGIVLDAASPALMQIAGALKGRGGLDAVHIVAHGQPGEVL